MLQLTVGMQQNLAAMASRMLTVLCFGTLTPILLILAPLATYLNLRALEWVKLHSEQRPFGEVLAEQILVQTPIFIFRNLGFIISVGLAIFVFLDLVTHATCPPRDQ